MYSSPSSPASIHLFAPGRDFYAHDGLAQRPANTGVTRCQCQTIRLCRAPLSGPKPRLSPIPPDDT